MVEFAIFVVCFFFVSIGAIVNSWGWSKSDKVISELLEEKDKWKDRYLLAQAEIVNARAEINFLRNLLEEKEDVK